MDSTDAPEHYFTAEPATPQERRTHIVSLAEFDVEIVGAGGVFSPGRVDAGTAVLLRHVPPLPPSGHVLDLGCGWGPLALTAALRQPERTDGEVWAVDVNTRAMDLCATNADRISQALPMARVRTTGPDEVPDEIRFAAIWSNPPIRIGKEALHELLMRWLPRLEPSATAWLVVQRNLGSDSLQDWLQRELGAAWSVDRMASSKGYRVIAVTSPEE